METKTFWRAARSRPAGAAIVLLLAGCTALPRAPVSRRLVPSPEEAQEAVPGESAVSSASTGEELPSDATLDAYRLYAARNNPGLKALYQSWRAQAERAPQVRALPEPRFTYTEYLREVETRTGPQDRSFGLTQSFPWFGKLSLRGSIEEEAARAAWQRFLAAQLALDHELRTAYADYYYLGRSISITRENLELLSRLERVALEKLAAGGENHSDVIRLQVEIGRLEDRLTTLRDMRRPLATRLGSILHGAQDAEIPWPGELPAVSPPPDVEEVLRFIEVNNPELTALRHEVETGALKKKLAFKEYFPDFSVGVQTISTGSALAPGTRDSGDDPLLVTFSLDIPIWYSKYRAGEREAEASWLAAKERHEDARSRLVADVELALYHLRDAGRRTELYENTLVPLGQESLSSTEASFQADNADFLDLIDAERVLLEFQLSLEAARRDRLRADAKLDRLLGRYVIENRETENSEQETQP